VYDHFFEGNFEPFIIKIITFHKRKNIIEFREYNESAFQTTVEMLLPKSWVSEMRLITKNKKINGRPRYKFVDIFVYGVGIEQLDEISKPNVIIELKVISLWGLYSAKNNKVDHFVDYDLLMALNN
jgi:hypothetical protein